jgi:hypothetical protein
VIGINDRRFQCISIESDFRTERKSARFRLLHQPTQRSLIKQIVLVAAPNIGMGTNKPALFNIGEQARRRAYPVFGVANGPQCGSEVVAVLIDSKCVIAFWIGMNNPVCR